MSKSIFLLIGAALTTIALSCSAWAFPAYCFDTNPATRIASGSIQGSTINITGTNIGNFTGTFKSSSSYNFLLIGNFSTLLSTYSQLSSMKPVGNAGVTKTQGSPIWGNYPLYAIMFQLQKGEFSGLKSSLSLLGVNMNCSAPS